MRFKFILFLYWYIDISKLENSTKIVIVDVCKSFNGYAGRNVLVAALLVGFEIQHDLFECHEIGKWKEKLKNFTV